MMQRFLIIVTFNLIAFSCIGQNDDIELKALVDKITTEKRLNKQLLVRKSQLEKDKASENTKIVAIDAQLGKLNKQSTQLQIDIDSLSSSNNKLNQEISQKNRDNLNLKNKHTGQYKDVKSLYEKAEAENKKLQSSVDSLNAEIKRKNEKLDKLKKEKAQYNNVEAQYNQLEKEVSGLKKENENKEKILKSKKDSLVMFTSIWNNADKIKASNKKNLLAIEQRLCLRINSTTSLEDYLSGTHLASVRLSLDSIEQLGQYNIKSSNLNQCKISAERYVTFALWSQNSEKAINSDFDKNKINQLLIDGKKLTSLTSGQNNVKGRYEKLLVNYCNTYKKVLEDNKYLNSLTSADIIKREIDYLISNDYNEYPYIKSELNKKLKNPKYRCQFNQPAIPCD